MTLRAPLVFRTSTLLPALLGGLLLTACGPKATTGGGADYDGSEGGATQQVDEDEVKKAGEEAMALTKENHDLRREIFQLKNKLGIPVDQPDDPAGEGADAAKK